MNSLGKKKRKKLPKKFSVKRMWKCSQEKQELISGSNIRITEATPLQCRAAFLQMRKYTTPGHTD